MALTVLLIIGAILRFSCGASIGEYQQSPYWNLEEEVELQGLAPPVRNYEDLASFIGHFGNEFLERNSKGKSQEVMYKKRDTALLLDKMMFALKKIMSEKNPELKNGESYKNIINAISGNELGSPLGGAMKPNNVSGLERRGNSKGKVYWRCYFNAVSCF